MLCISRDEEKRRGKDLFSQRWKSRFFPRLLRFAKQSVRGQNDILELKEAPFVDPSSLKFKAAELMQ